MFAKINHLAIVSENYAALCKFYESVFGMRTLGETRPHRAVTVGDGYVGLNINPRREGRMARLDHFGIEVEDVDLATERMRKAYPKLKRLKRPSTRPFAGYTTHDPAGNVFELSQQGMENRTDLYAASGWEQPRAIDHIAIRTINADEVAQFYADVFEFIPLNKGAGDPNHYLSDGRITLELIPWDITSSEGTSIIMPGMDHFGFKVESLAALKDDIETVSTNPHLRPVGLGIGREGKNRLDIFKRTCPLGAFHMADSDGVLIDARE